MKGKKSKVKGKVTPAVRKYVRKALSANIEDKYILQDVPVTNPIPYTGTMALVSYSPAITQGTGVSNRIGDAIKLHNLNLRIHLACPATYNAYARVMLIRYKQQDGRDLVVNDIMSTSAGYGPDRPLYPPSQLSEKVHILYDKVHQVTATGNVTADEQHKVLIIKKYLGFKQTFLRNAGSGTYADIATNGVYLLIFGSQDSGGIARCILRDCQWTMTYEDA